MAEAKPKILWVDDEIDLLKSHVRFLEDKGYVVTTALTGQDAITLVSGQSFSVVLLDEIMPGMDGLSTLQAIKDVDQAIPVIMVTKSTEESLMDEAYWGDIADFIVKPVNPHQILSSLKKILELESLRRDRFVAEFGSYYNRVQQVLYGGELTFSEWADIYIEMCAANREIDALNVTDLKGLQSDLYREADKVFSSWLVSRFPDWLSGDDPGAPTLSHNLLEKLVFPLMTDKKPVYMIVIDCLRKR
jgi:CheY-like chemotaxis protein